MRRLLPLPLTILVEIDDPDCLAGRIMLYPGGVAFGAYLKFAGLLSFGNLGVKRRQFGAGLAAL